MSYITWNEKMLLHVPVIDDQHKKLVDMINRLHESLVAGEGNKSVKTVLSALVEYVILHFSEEERLMKKYDYPSYMKHKKLHDHYVGQLKEFIRKNKNNPPLLARELLLFLGEWARHHIGIEDVGIASYLKNHMDTTSPDSA